MQSSSSGSAAVGGAWKAWTVRDGLEFVAPDGLTYVARVEAGVIDGRLHRFFAPFRGEVGEAGWRVWAPLEWKERANVSEDGTFGVLCFRDAEGTDFAVEFHYRRGPVELLSVLEKIAAARPQEDEDGQGEFQLAAESSARGRAEAEGPGELGAEVDQGGEAIRWRPWRRRQDEGLIGPGNAV
jgi:hypothetical protein